jgi:hypothetical protein
VHPIDSTLKHEWLCFDFLHGSLLRNEGPDSRVILSPILKASNETSQQLPSSGYTYLNVSLISYNCIEKFKLTQLFSILRNDFLSQIIATQTDANRGVSDN